MSKTNVLVLICFAAMVGLAGYAWILFSRVKRAEKEAASQKAKAEKASSRLAYFLRKEAAQDSSLRLAFRKDTSAQSALQYIKHANESSLRQNEPSFFQKASNLEKEAFTALTKNQFDKALDKFRQVEQTVPAFHNAYEIYSLLRKNKERFSDKAVQNAIKLQIVNDYSWKAPPELLIELKAQALLSGSTVIIYYTDTTMPKAQAIDRLLKGYGTSAHLEKPSYSIKKNDIVYNNENQIPYCEAARDIFRQIGYGEFGVRISSVADKKLEVFKIYVVK